MLTHILYLSIFPVVIAGMTCENISNIYQTAITVDGSLGCCGKSRDLHVSNKLLLDTEFTTNRPQCNLETREENVIVEMGDLPFIRDVNKSFVFPNGGGDIRQVSPFNHGVADMNISGTRVGLIRTNYADFGLGPNEPLAFNKSKTMREGGIGFVINHFMYGTFTSIRKEKFDENDTDFFIESGGHTPLNYAYFLTFPYMQVESTATEAQKTLAAHLNDGFCFNLYGMPRKCYKFVEGSTRSQCLPIVRTATSVQIA